ncbi:hypothetical protein [Caulobacter sp. RL271]|uniref:Uncharacterized protein n=1 Tax=Caulobacter segnis TaxID=88688 RepID=A0ABY4ZSK9_9CAUL|nr:hypothetical protein [Caulobacter segnis]USQ95703.1 hypothetical protein MZV50_24720 [Caulobacter segnis]
MANLTVSDPARPTINIQWDWSQIFEAEVGSGSAVIVSGREVSDYARALREEVRHRGGFLIEDRSDIETILRRVESARANISLQLSHSVDDRIAGRFAIAQRKGAASNWSIEDYHQRLLFDDKYFREFQVFKAAIDNAVAAIDRGIIFYPAHVAQSSYFRLFLPLIIKECKSALWIIYSSGRVEELSEFFQVEREYIDKSSVINALGEIFKLDSSSIDIILAKSEDFARFSTGAEGFTEAEMFRFIKWAHNFIVRQAGEFLPRVPLAHAAPIEFEIVRHKITATDEKVVTSLRRPIIDGIVEELVHQVDDVPKHFNLHNMAPACNTKLMRVREHLVEIRDEGLSETRVLKLGIRTQACREHLRFEVENLDRPAEGAIHTALAQIEGFVARFTEWRSYVQDGDLGSADRVAENDLGPAINVLEGFNAPQIVDEKGSVALSRAIYEAKSDATTNVERRGVLRVLHNLVSKAFSSLKDAISDDWGKNASKLFYMVLVRVVLALEAAFKVLADQHPLMFGWTAAFITWVRTFASK